jgi:hypothetical protein
MKVRVEAQFNVGDGFIFFRGNPPGCAVWQSPGATAGTQLSPRHP